MGPFVGGSPMQLDYTLTTSASSAFCSVSQIQTAKTLAATEQSLYSYRDDQTKPKFNGKLDTAMNGDGSAETSVLTEINKTAFEEALKNQIQRFGLQTFFYIPDVQQTEMIFLVEHAHKLTLCNVIDKHLLRSNEPVPI